MNKSLLTIIWSMLTLPDLLAQTKLGTQQYYYWDPSRSTTVVPMAHFESGNNWYGEVRYNYEEEKTFSLVAGRRFHIGKKESISLVPALGYSMGIFTGWSCILNTDMEWKGFFLTVQSQYAYNSKQPLNSFFFNWSETGMTINKKYFMGLAIQQTYSRRENSLSAGVMAGLNLGAFSFPLYLFNPFDNSKYLVMGIVFEQNFFKKRRTLN